MGAVGLLLPRWFACAVIVATGCQSDPGAADWQAMIKEQLPLLGHRNFIVIADAAYPLQVSPGVMTTEAEGDHLEVLDYLLRELEKSGHVRPVIWLDSELQYVSESHASGVGRMRDAFDERLSGLEVRRAPHEEIIQRLDDTAALFQVVILKTDLKIPYTSVFIELECGYWPSEAERDLRRSIADADQEQDDQ